jgi:hypothetical protein
LASFSTIHGVPPLSASLTWGAIGVVSAVVLLGAWSIGVFYLPVVVLLLVAALLHDRRQRRRVARHFGIGAVAALAQAALMVVVVALLAS